MQQTATHGWHNWTQYSAPLRNVLASYEEKIKFTDSSFYLQTTDILSTHVRLVFIITDFNTPVDADLSCSKTLKDNGRINHESFIRIPSGRINI